MASPKFEWLCQVPDKSNALQNRLAARPEHLKDLKPRIDSGVVVFGGATLSEQPAGEGTPAMNGSVLLIKADTKEEVLQILKNDPYTKNGAWDVENATITPFKSAVRTAL